MEKRKLSLPSGVLVVAGVALLVLIVASSSYTQIGYGTVGLVTRFGAVTGRVMQPGLNWKIPLIESVIPYRTQEIVYQTASEGESQAEYVDFPTDTTTSDGQQIILKYSIRFRIDPARASWIANNIGNERDVVEKVVKFHSRILARNIPKEYAALDLYAGNVQEVQDQFEEQLKPLFAEKGIILDSFGLRKIEFADDYKQAVEQKQIEAETITTEQHRAEQATYQAQAKVELAKGDAEKTKLLAEAEAEAIQIKGEALAKYPDVIQLRFVESLSDPESKVNWGIMPPGSFVPFLNLTPGETAPGTTVAPSTVVTETTP